MPSGMALFNQTNGGCFMKSELQAGKQYIWSVEAGVTGGGKVTDVFIFTVAETVK